MLYPYSYPFLIRSSSHPLHRRLLLLPTSVRLGWSSACGVASCLLWAGAVIHGGGAEANARTNGIVAKHEGHHCNMSG